MKTVRRSHILQFKENKYDYILNKVKKEAEKDAQDINSVILEEQSFTDDELQRIQDLIVSNNHVIGIFNYYLKEENVISELRICKHSDPDTPFHRGSIIMNNDELDNFESQYKITKDQFQEYLFILEQQENLQSFTREYCESFFLLDSEEFEVLWSLVCPFSPHRIGRGGFLVMLHLTRIEKPIPERLSPALSHLLCTGILPEEYFLHHKLKDDLKRLNHMKDSLTNL